MVDLVGPLEPESEGCRYILTAMDVFSLWSWLTPLVNKEPGEVSGALYRNVYLDCAHFRSYSGATTDPSSQQT